MAEMTVYGRALTLDYIIGLGIYLSLHTDSPTEVGSHVHEVSGGGYAREPITAKMSATDADGISINTSLIRFGPALTPWGTITHIGIEDALTAGNMLAWAPGSSAVNRSTGQVLQFAADQLSLRFE